MRCASRGCTWRNLPGDLPRWQTVYTYFRNWRKDGTWIAIHEQLRDWVRSEQERKPAPSEAIIDSQSVKTVAKSAVLGFPQVEHLFKTAMLNQSVGYDAGKKIKGRKRFVTVDTLGLVLSVFVTAASQTERECGKIVLQRLHEKGKRIARLHTICVDGGFTGDSFMMWVKDMCHWVVQVVLRPPEQQGFVLLPKRWVVERTFGWLSWCRRLSRDCEGLPETSEMWIYIAIIRIIVRRLA
ncbi:MAG: IS5 family transposase [Chamaesiphon sp.]|nr:IS5 family transposase [Chamaesiphon sp.]